MRRLAAGVGVALLWQLPLAAQERDRSLERISVALEQSAPLVDGRFPLADGPAPPFTLGPFTFVQPTLRGEIVRISLPIGEFVTKAFKGVAAANQRRQEAAARRRVEAALEQFEQQQPPQ